MKLEMPGFAGRLANRVKLGMPDLASWLASRAKLGMPGLAGRLAIVTGLLVTLAVASMLVVGVRSLRSQAEAQALTRVQLGVSAAREGLRQATEDVLTAARILGERPVLQRQVRSATFDALYLTRYCENASLDACAIVRGGEVLASAGSDIQWPALIVAAGEQGERFLVTGAAPQTALVGASAPVTEHDGVNVLAVRRMNEKFAARLAERAGLEIRIVDFSSFVPGQGPLAILNTDALS